MIDELIRKAAVDDEDAIDELSAIADNEPDQLIPHHGLLLDLDVLWPPKLYRSADANTVGRVIEQIDGGRTPKRLDHLLLLLACSAHPLAESAMRRWATQPPAGADRLHTDPLNYARAGGWTVSPDGSRRNLCGDSAYQWLMRETARRTDAPECPWCASPLWVAADLDTAEPAVGDALAHTGWSGRLVIEACHFCACHATLYSQVTPTGSAIWWSGNTRPSYLPDDAEAEEPPALLPVVGPTRTGPYQASAWNQGGSTLGGQPDWIQDAEHVDCPGCQQPMDYVGLVVGADLDEFGEGAYYLHVHQPCGFAAVNFQQS